MDIQGVVSLVGDNNVTLVKAVCGCGGDKAPLLAEAIKRRNLTMPHVFYNVARELGFGCQNCLVAMSEYEAVESDVFESEGVIPPLYAEKLTDPRFNPRSQDGTAGFVELVKLDGSIFDEPNYWGEDGDVLVVRGDIDAEEAARRMSKFDESCTCEPCHIKPEELIKMKSYLFWDEPESDFSWWLAYGPIPSEAKQVLEVWTADQYAGRGSR